MDKSSGRNPVLNTGSDSAKHHTGTAAEQHARATSAGSATRVTNVHPNGAVGVGDAQAAEYFRKTGVRPCETKPVC